MRKRVALLLTVVGLLPFASARAQVNLSAGISIGNDGVEGFHLAISQHYHVRNEVVIAYRAKKIPDDHLPVVFFLAGRANVSPDVVVGLRLSGKSWMDISLQLGLRPDVFYVEVDSPGPPYGRALGHFKKKKRGQWGSIRLVDDDIVGLVNLKFISAHHGYSPNQVIKLRVKGDSFLKLHGRAKLGKAKLRVKVKTPSKVGISVKLNGGKPSRHKAKGFHAGGGKKRGGKGKKGRK